MMKRKFILSIFICCLTLGSVSAQKQLDGFLNLGENALGDINILAKEYMRPYGEMLGTNLNSGWYSSAKPHKLLGFELTVTGTYTMSPSSAKTFDISKLDLETMNLSGSNTMAPTMAGIMSESKRPILTDTLTELSSVNLPNGSGSSSMISPMVTAGVGLPKGIEIKARFSPELDFGDMGKFSLWGVGVQKSIKDYIPFVKRVPFLAMSVLGGYTSFASNVSTGSDQNLEISANALTGRVLVGANLPVVAFYAGLGYGQSNTDMDLKGDFAGFTSNNPISLAYKTTAFDFNIGTRLRFGVFGFNIDYTVGDYSAVTAGIGLNFR